MKTKIFVYFFMTCALFACRTQKPVVEIPVRTEIIVKDRLIPVTVPDDSLTLYALLECDSNYNVLLKSYNEEKSKGVESGLSFDGNNLKYKAIVSRDTVFVNGKDSLVYQEILLKVPVPYEVNRLTGFQNFQIWCGRILLAVVLIYFAVIAVRNKLI